MTKSCLIIADRFEPTADCLLGELRRRDIPCLRWNLDRFPLGSSLTFRFGAGHPGGEISSDGRTVELEAIGSVWCRGFRPSGFPDDLGEEDRKFVQDEAQRTMDALLAILNVRWINHPQCHTRANAKAAQLAAAHHVGLEIPPTVMTNDPQEARRFIAGAAAATIYKANSQSLNLEPGKALYTGVLTDKELGKLDLIQLTPGIFQALVPKAYEIRATVVGARIFAGKINSQASSETMIDWRRKPFDIEKEPITLPPDVETKIHALMGWFGLIYGAFDFIVTPDGRHVFLEVNPAGQYLWVETTTKLPITAAIADELGEPCAS